MLLKKYEILADFKMGNMGNCLVVQQVKYPRCHCSGPGHHCGMDSVLDLGISTCHGHGHTFFLKGLLVHLIDFGVLCFHFDLP